MRVAVTYSYRTKIGGIETYLATVTKGLAQSGHDVSYWYEVKSDPTSEQIELPQSAPARCFEELGVERGLTALCDWKPDIIYAHGFLDPMLEEAVLKIAPAVVFAHGFYGTCISGSKTFRHPNSVGCDRRFGPMCLVNYHARGCGGLNPLTMFREYSRQSERLRSLRTYRAIITASKFMRAEFVRNGLMAEKVHTLLYPVTNGNRKTPAAAVSQNGPAISESRLLFLGRMTHLKGGQLLIDALPRVKAILGTPLRVTFAGDGPERHDWKRKAELMQSRYAGLDINFPGWVSGENLESTLRDSDLLVVPSVWPEPFGLVGPEAGLFGLPAAAFDVGGIRDWLSDGINGFLAPGNPPTSKALADAIVKCLRDAGTHARLRAGAFELAQRFSMQNHLTALFEVFSSVTGRDFSTSAQRQCESAISVA